MRRPRRQQGSGSHSTPSEPVKPVTVSSLVAKLTPGTKLGSVESMILKKLERSRVPYT